MFLLVQLLPAVAYADNPSTSFAAKFVHTSLNKNRCSINRVLVSLWEFDVLEYACCINLFEILSISCLLHLRYFVVAFYDYLCSCFQVQVKICCSFYARNTFFI